jgi:hypothetical protein
MNAKSKKILPEQNSVVPLIGGQSGYVKNAKVIATMGSHVNLIFTDERNAQKNVEGRVAFSCMVTPKVNDTVLCVQNDSGMHIVLAILDRPDDVAGSQDMTLNFPGSVTMQSLDGSVGILAKENVSIVAAESLSCTSDKTLHKSEVANICYGNTTMLGEGLTAQFKTVHFMADMVNTLAKIVMQKFNHYVRRTSENDLVSAAQMDRKVDGLYSMNSKITMMVSEKDTKIDGERIHMG